MKHDFVNARKHASVRVQRISHEYVHANNILRNVVCITFDGAFVTRRGFCTLCLITSEAFYSIIKLYSKVFLKVQTVMIVRFVLWSKGSPP